MEVEVDMSWVFGRHGKIAIGSWGGTVLVGLITVWVGYTF